MTTEHSSRGQSWKELYQAAMLESDSTKLQLLLDDAMNSVLDQIEETHTDTELEDLNNALNGLRSRTKQVSNSKSGHSDNSAQTKAA